MLTRAYKVCLNTLNFEIRASVRDLIGRYGVRKYYRQKNLMLNLGCGEIHKDGWINIDLTSKKADFHLDLRKRLPFRNNSCKEIYSEHFLEHLSYPDDALFFLSETYRVLDNGGKLTVVVPDTSWPLIDYSKGKSSDYFRITKKKEWCSKEYRTRMEFINYHFRQDGEHLYAYDEESLRYVLKKSGFKQNRRRQFNSKIDDIYHTPGSLYMESIK